MHKSKFIKSKIIAIFFIILITIFIFLYFKKENDKVFFHPGEIKNYKINDDNFIITISRKLNVGSTIEIYNNELKLLKRLNVNFEELIRKGFRDDKEYSFSKNNHLSSTLEFIDPIFNLKNYNFVSHTKSGFAFELDACGNLIWINNKERFHGNILKNNAGNYLFKNYKYPLSKSAKIYNKNYSFHEDSISEIDKTGNIIKQFSIFEILLKNNLLNINDINSTMPLDFIDLEIFENSNNIWQKNDLLISLSKISLILIYRPKNDKIIKIIKGPFSRQSDVDIIGNKIIIFDNNTIYNEKGEINKFPNIYSYNIFQDKFKKIFTDIHKKLNLRNSYNSSGEIIGNKIIVSSKDKGELYYLDENLEKIWSFKNKDNNLIYPITSFKIYKSNQALEEKILNIKCD